MRETITVSLPGRLKRQLDRLVKQTDATRSDLVRQAVQEYLLRTEFQRLRRAGVAAARRQGIFTDEDVFESVS